MSSNDWQAYNVCLAWIFGRFLIAADCVELRDRQTTDLWVGGSNPSGRAKQINPRRSGPSRRKPHGHSRTLAQAAFNPELTLVKLDDVLDDRESESGPAEFARTRAVDPIEAFRQSRNVGGRDSLPGVGDDKLDPGLAAISGNRGGKIGR